MDKKIQNIKIRQYILDCIDSEAYEVKAETEKEKLQFLYDTFKSEYGWAIPRMGELRAFKEWCQGLPSSFGIDFENYRILEIAYMWGSLKPDAKEYQKDSILGNWFNFVANKTFQLFRRYKVI